MRKSLALDINSEKNPGCVTDRIGPKTEINPLVEQELLRQGAPGQSALEVIRERGTFGNAPDLPAALRRRFPVALEIAPRWHVRMQAAFQAHVDAAVSKAVNLPADASAQAVREVFDLARGLCLKGITVYRDGSRGGQTLSPDQCSRAAGLQRMRGIDQGLGSSAV
jgi:ribonucleotide reductase alpha subunit